MHAAALKSRLGDSKSPRASRPQHLRQSPEPAGLDSRDDAHAMRCANGHWGERTGSHPSAREEEPWQPLWKPRASPWVSAAGAGRLPPLHVCFLWCHAAVLQSTGGSVGRRDGDSGCRCDGQRHHQRRAAGTGVAPEGCRALRLGKAGRRRSPCLSRCGLRRAGPGAQPLRTRTQLRSCSGAAGKDRKGKHRKGKHHGPLPVPSGFSTPAAAAGALSPRGQGSRLRRGSGSALCSACFPGFWTEGSGSGRGRSARPRAT
ncbi:PREDICTED: uncharacterized protein LOC106148242 [Chinchilla lanigera]|uniref:uncharacterized protein LOC106148242 n=1 Tax=Chinchilla lanigera TaxID=34839 RepID=UPI000697BBB9|nr:PREDICTED: uncharacterized protein LOC106148242 [Chinchilla lanigera]